MDTPSREIAELEDIARRIRIRMITMVGGAKAGHLGGSLSAAELLTALYFRILNVNPARPSWEERDRFVLSKGHATPLYYAALAARGYFPEEWLERYDRIDSPLQGHPDMTKTPGVDMTTGSLGQGFSAAVGMCIGRDLTRKRFRVYVLVGDGELQEGQAWEAAMYAGVHALRGLVCIVDRNDLQLSCAVRDALPLDPLPDKWRSFGWRVLECDGHSMPAVLSALEEARSNTQGPVAIIARTVKGKGVSFMENEVAWHSRTPTRVEVARALEELGASEAEVEPWRE